MDDIRHRLETYRDDGSPTGETAYLFQPRSFMLIGSLGEFLTEHGINKPKLSSFELFRRNMFTPEIITFDEMFEPAKYIVQNTEDEMADSGLIPASGQ